MDGLFTYRGYDRPLWLKKWSIILDDDSVLIKTVHFRRTIHFKGGNCTFWAFEVSNAIDTSVLL